MPAGERRRGGARAGRRAAAGRRPSWQKITRWLPVPRALCPQCAHAHLMQPDVQLHRSAELPECATHISAAPSHPLCRCDQLTCRRSPPAAQMNGVFSAVGGDLRKETNAFALSRMSMAPALHREEDVAELEVRWVGGPGG